MTLCDDEDLRFKIKAKITEIAHSTPGGASQEMIDLFLELEDLISEAFEPEDDDGG
jgi:hypothetical protein